ncbi:hypothetical protein KC19_VG002600 [Ceratodon purpureus]|uniref:Uncharacterized protein n=1 Tax=Ceratodon purpureus TaxID=3225 RepID=A0A8T0HKI7_CERPU|nr:hypothetical protein KC19_VG002600 [Ceratodon purpureus]
MAKRLLLRRGISFDIIFSLRTCTLTFPTDCFCIGAPASPISSLTPYLAPSSCGCNNNCRSNSEGVSIHKEKLWCLHKPLSPCFQAQTDTGIIRNESLPCRLSTPKTTNSSA